MTKQMTDADYKEYMRIASEVAKATSKTLITGAKGEGHIITAAMAIVIASLEKQHPGVMKDIMTGAVLLNSIDAIVVEGEDEDIDENRVIN